MKECDTKILKLKARGRRMKPTPAELVLWESLRCRQLEGYSFRRQHVLAPYIVDFYCAELSLAIEIKEEGFLYAGTDRDETLKESRDIDVLRFTEPQVLGELASVLETITDYAAKHAERRAA